MNLQTLVLKELETIITNADYTFVHNPAHANTGNCEVRTKRLTCVLRFSYFFQDHEFGITVRQGNGKEVIKLFSMKNFENKKVRNLIDWFSNRFHDDTEEPFFPHDLTSTTGPEEEPPQTQILGTIDNLALQLQKELQNIDDWAAFLIKDFNTNKHYTETKEGLKKRVQQLYQTGTTIKNLHQNITDSGRLLLKQLGD